MSEQLKFDAVVIGAGHNGLAAAATLARKGKSVCVVEKAKNIGGMCRNSDIEPGISVPLMAHLLYNLNPKVAEELGLSELLKSPPLCTVALSPDGRHIEIIGDDVRYADGSEHSEAKTYAELTKRLRKFATLLGQMSTKSPPKLDGEAGGMDKISELASLAKLGFDLKRMGKKDMREFLRVLLSNIQDLLLDDLADEPLAGMLAADAVRGNYAGPRSPGTVFSLMYRLGNSGQVHQPKGGMGAVSEAFLSSARKAGCDIRTGMGVAEITVSEDRTTGVRLEDGSVILADFVLSSAGPKQTMGMAGVEHFDVEAARRIRNIRCKGTVAKLNLVLKSAPEFPGLSIKQQAARLVVAPSVTYVERAFNPVKYDELPTAPTIEFVLPTLIDPDLWPDGEHVLSAVVQYVPHTPKGGWTQKARQTLTDTILRTLETYMPGLGGLIKQSQLLTPSDIEAQTGAPGGHWHHAEMGIDQILTVRPVNGLAHYQFAVSGLYLCGASAHPGGDVTGAPGRNAALQLLKDEGQR